ncbi:pyridine nucleotide-disulfide oxidoreductase [Rhizobium sullae]|uniref:Pyridine nucleotide-disulfide oxidoreductase n=1 Tax=Rhizobium sullae TaxID=50338 RepID=A0A2N0D1D1_RHISU|nr:pyridine nucleotide-disulfide oxidoreductase [Rhizobium sullae]
MAGPVSKRIVLVGAGHAHLHILKNIGALVRLGAEVTVVAQDDFWYSGMATGMLGGLFPPEADHVNVSALVNGTGATLHRGTMIELDRSAREVVLEGGRRIGFDLLSLNLGSVPPPLPGMGQSVYAVKPVRSLVELRQRIEEYWRGADTDPLRVAVVGGGVTGIEIAANLRALSDRHGHCMDITVYSRSEPLRRIPRGAAAALLRHLRTANIDVRWPVAVTSIKECGVLLDGGTPQDCDIIINATGLMPPDLTARLGLPVDGDGALIVDRFLRSAGDTSVFAVGDCVAFDGRSLPRAGVYAVRQAPILFANLAAALSGTPPIPFVPQRRFLAIIGLGHRSAVMIRGPVWFKGPPALWLKRWIDQRFVDGYRRGSKTTHHSALNQISP